MLAYLRIRGLALLDDVSLELGGGMTVLTGETGAGKSIIVGALSLLRGARARAGMVRAGEAAAIIDARFDPGPAAWTRLCARMDELGVSLGAREEGLIVRRTISKSGRSRCFVQDAPATQAALASVGELLVDICSQHEHHFLTHAGHHLQVLDAYAGCERALAEYREAYDDWRRSVAALASLTERTADRAQRADYLRFQIEELEQVAPQPGEHEALSRKLSLLQGVRKWAEFSEQARALLYEDDRAIAGQLAALAARASAGADTSATLAEVAEHLTAAQLLCEDAARAVARLEDELDLDPEALECAEQRVHVLQSLRRKHGVDSDTLAERLAHMQAELAELEDAEARIAAAQAGEARERGRCVQLARALHEQRAAAAEGLGNAVVQELSALHLGGARLCVHVTAEHPETPGPSGVDRAEFLFSANPGEPMAPLSRVASGGELSRVLLALKGALSTGDRVATYVFDEVDAGVGGRVADAIGHRLQAAASAHQVLCVTHLPQIAAFASCHLRVDKTTRKGRTTTAVHVLSAPERAAELARMLGGAKTSATQHARRLLADAAKPVRRPRTARRPRVGVRV